MWERFMGLWPWKPGGFIDPREQASQRYSLQHNIRMTAQEYAYYACQFIDGIQGDDASRGGCPFYIWRDWIVGRGERKFFEQTGVNEAPVIEWAPSMAQLTSAIHDNISELWQQIAETQSAGTWGSPE